MGRATRLHDPAEVAVTVITAHQALAAAGEDFDDGPGAPAAPAAPGHANGDPVAVQHGAHFGHRQEHVVRAVIRHQKPEAIPVRGDRARDHVELVAQTVLAAAIDQQLARRPQRLETTAQVRNLPFAGNPQRCGHGRQGQGDALLPEGVE